MFALMLALLVPTALEKPAKAPKEPPVQALTSAADTLKKEIVQQVKSLEYADQVAQDFVLMVRDWNLAELKQKLTQAREDQKQGKMSREAVAKVEEDVTKKIAQQIRKEMKPADYFELAEVVKKKQANCLGFSQLFTILGTSLGLSVQPIEVEELAGGSIPLGGGHVACLVHWADDRSVIVDIAMGFRFQEERPFLIGTYTWVSNEPISRSFVLGESFGKVGHSWQIKDITNPLNLHRKIRVVASKGLLAGLYNNRAGHFRREKKNKEALTVITRAVELDPWLTLARTNRGEINHELQNYAEAIADYTKVVENNPPFSTVAVYILRGSSYWPLKKYQEAVADFSKAIEINLMKYQEGAADATRAVEMNALTAKAYAGRGFVYQLQGQLTEALADFNDSLRLDPKAFQVYVSRGQVHAAQQKFDAAVNDLTEALRLNPKNAYVYSIRGAIWCARKDYDQAIKDFDAAIRLEPKNAVYYFALGTIWGYNKKDYDRALKNFDEAIRLDPKSAVAYRNRGNTYAVKKKYDAAINDFTEALRLDPKNDFTYIARASTTRPKRTTVKPSPISPRPSASTRKTPMSTMAWPGSGQSVRKATSAMARKRSNTPGKPVI